MSAPDRAATGLHEQAELLLGSVEKLLEEHQELARQRGENFNVFRLLGIEHDEDRLHSRFIAELLDPRGSHQQKDTFLRLFLKEVLERIENGRQDWIETEKASVVREKYVGPTDMRGEGSKGGRIDIFITDNSRHLSIENKIGSGEGDKQVTRYCNYDEDNNFVLFLSLDGKDADTDKTNYSPISYREDILRWLKACHDDADLSILRETIKQYITTVKSQTRGLAMHEAKAEIRTAMKRHYQAARAIQEDFHQMLSDEVEALVKKVRTRISAEVSERRWGIDSRDGTWGLVLRPKERNRWGDTKVEWEKSWIGIRDPTESLRKAWRSGEKPQVPPFNHDDQWGLWRDVPEAQFESEDGIELLFSDSPGSDNDRDQLADRLKDELVTLADYCDKHFRERSS